jgi:hypothetical protein
LPEIQRVRLGEIQELENDGGDAPEMLRPDLPFPDFGEGARGDRRRESGRIEASQAGKEQPVAARVPAKAHIAHLVAWVALEVLLRPELERVHEHGDGDPVVLLARAADQREMTFMEGAHRRDEAHGHAALARAAGERAELGAAGYDPHGFFSVLSGDAA